MDNKEKKKLYGKQYYQENKERIKQYYQKNKEEKKLYEKQYYQKNKEEILLQKKLYNEDHKEKIKQRKKQYNKTPEGKKSLRISYWKYQGIIFPDFELLYDIYIETTHCDECKCLLNQCTRSRKCVDHDHDIKDCDNVRNILCHCCNTTRG
tara:strand:- start:513 stop:965 length:453 start_codon:yes stop_codon:yes gene_type:complete